MDKIHHFIRFGSTSSDSELISLVRGGMHAQPIAERKGWLAQLELSLDGYGGPQSERAARVRELTAQIDAGEEQETAIVLNAPAPETSDNP